MMKKSGLPKYVVKKTSPRGGGVKVVHYYFQRQEFRIRMPEPDAPDFMDAYHVALGKMKVSPHYFKSWGGEDAIMNNNVLDQYFSRREATAKKRATISGREYCLPKYWGADQYMKQKGRCALSGVVMRMAQGLMDPYCPTIDRIDSGVGYTAENCQLVALRVNMAKNNMTEPDFIKMCRSVVKMGLERIGNEQGKLSHPLKQKSQIKTNQGVASE